VAKAKGRYSDEVSDYGALQKAVRRGFRILTAQSHSFLTFRERQWLFLEMGRRMFRVGRRCDVVLLSFPRSGNHAVRYLLESASGRPTLGAADREDRIFPSGLHDLPLFLRLRLGRVQARVPVAVKRHKLYGHDNFQRLIYLERPIVEAVLSQCRGMSDVEFENHVEEMVEWWLKLRETYESWRLEHRLKVAYQDIVTQKARSFQAILEFVGLSPSKISRALQTVELEAARTALRRKPGSRNYEDLYPHRAERVKILVKSVEKYGGQKN